MGGAGLHAGFEFADHLRGDLLYGGQDHFVLVAKIEINPPLGDPGLFGHALHGHRVEALGRYGLTGRLQDRPGAEALENLSAADAGHFSESEFS